MVQPDPRHERDDHQELVSLRKRLELMQTMEQLAQVGAWNINLVTSDVNSSPGIHQVFDADPDAHDSIQDAMARCLPEYRPQLEATVNHATANGLPYSVELPFLTAKGRQIWVRAVGSPVRADNSAGEAPVVGYRGVLVDVTVEHNALADVQLLNAELEQRVIDRTTSLAAANAELESFSYSVSHDLRSPLRAITGFAQLLETRYGDSLEPRARHYLNNIRTASEQMGILIEELLEYSKLGYEPAVTRSVELSPLMGRLTDTFAGRAAAIGATIEVEQSMPTPLGDLTLIDQILMNLIDNALKYHHPDVAPIIEISAHEEEGLVSINVKDNGIGIAEEYSERIFEVFQRLHSDAEFPGTGIGLASARKAATRMRGTVAVQSTPGVGSTFTLTLPSAAATQGGNS